MSDAHAVARDQLRAFIERIERLEEEKKTIADDIKDVYGEAKGTGFDTKVLRKLISIRKQDRDERAEQEAILDMYMIALGMVDEPAAYDEPHQSASVQHQPAMALRADGGLSILTKHEDIRTAPVSAEETPKQVYGDSVEDATAAPSQSVDIPAGGDQAQKIDGSAVRYPAELNSPEQALPSDDGAIAAVNGKAGLANADGVEPPSSGHAETHSAEREDCAAANAGGDDVDRSAARATTSNTGEGAACALPAKSSIRLLCRNPGETCGGYGRKHCRACEMAAAELEAAE